MQRSPDEIYDKFIALQSGYGERNAILDDYDKIFDGEHWPADFEPGTETEFRLVLNYCRAVNLKYASMFARRPNVRIPILDPTPSVRLRARKREVLIRSLWGALSAAWHDVEMNATTKGYGVLQVLWAPTETDVEWAGDRQQYVRSPLRFRSINPKHFFPMYRTFDAPDDFLFVIRYDPGRLVEDIERQYKVSLMNAVRKAGIDDDRVLSLEDTVDLIEYWDHEHYHLIARVHVSWVVDDGRSGMEKETRVTTLKEFAHEYKRIPFWVLSNIRVPHRDPTYGGSISDVDTIFSVNQHLNLILSEAAEEIITNIHRPVVYKSDDHQQDPAGISLKPKAVNPIGAEEELEVLHWPGIPQSVDAHIQQMILALQDLSFIGQSGFGQYPQGATGVGLRLILQSLEQILVLKTPLRIDVLTKVCEFIFKLCETKLRDSKFRWWVWSNNGFTQLEVTPEDIAGEYHIYIDYGNLLPREEISFQQNEVYKYKTGVQSLYTTLDNLGVHDPDAEIARIREEHQDPLLHPEFAGAAPPKGGAGGVEAPPIPGLPAEMGGPAPFGAGTPMMDRQATGPNLSAVAGLRPGLNTGDRRGTQTTA